MNSEALKERQKTLARERKQRSRKRHSGKENAILQPAKKTKQTTEISLPKARIYPWVSFWITTSYIRLYEL